MGQARRFGCENVRTTTLLSAAAVLIGINLTMCHILIEGFARGISVENKFLTFYICSKNYFMAS